MRDVISLPDATLFNKKESNIRIPVLLNLSNVLQTDEVLRKCCILSLFVNLFNNLENT